MRYRVNNRVQHGVSSLSTRTYEPGEIIDLSEEHAAPLLECGAIEPEHKPFDLKVNEVFIRSGK